MSTTHLTVIGIDNGASGSIGVLNTYGVTPYFGSVPTQDSVYYARSRASLPRRLDRKQLTSFLRGFRDFGEVRAFVERPFTGKFVHAMLLSHRFFEATICTLEDLGIGLEVVDSRDWQKPLFGGIKGSDELKRASKIRGIELYPKLKDAITKQGDADGLLIAHHFFRVLRS